jgi:magnesium transporter
MDVLEAHTDAVRNLSELYLTSVSNRVNEILRVLTIISTIFIPLSFVAGVYGMNFEHMPELRWRWGYPAILLVMGAMAGGMLLFFARKGWLRKSDMPRLPSITRPTPFFDEPAKQRDAAPASAPDRARTPPP